jgi:tripartite-type tricarboxylate transporter receptor subunit TctC
MRQEGDIMRLPRRRFLGLAAAALALPAAPARAQAYPNHPIRLFVGYPAGGQVDIIARLAAQALSDKLGQPIVVENKPGAGGSLGAETIVHAPPDGYTLFFGTASNAVNTTLFEKLSYDFTRDTTAISPINRIPLVLEVNPSFPAKSVAEFIAAAKDKPGAIATGSPSAGTPPFLAVELLKMMAGINVVHVPYVGENQMMTDLLGGQLMTGLGGISSSIGHIKAGKIRVLGVTTATRLDEFPDVPPIGETIPGFEASGWSGVVGPKGLPQDVVDKLYGAIKAIQADAQFRTRLADFGVTALTMPPAAFTQFIADETVKWGKVVKFAGLKPQ